MKVQNFDKYEINKAYEKLYFQKDQPFCQIFIVKIISERINGQRWKNERLEQRYQSREISNLLHGILLIKKSITKTLKNQTGSFYCICIEIQIILHGES